MRRGFAIAAGILFVLGARAATAQTNGSFEARRLAEELKLEYVRMPALGDKPPIAVHLSSSKHKVMLYVGMTHAMVDGEVWSLTEPVAAGEKDILVSPSLRERLARHFGVALPGVKLLQAPAPPERRSVKDRLVMLDPGHGGEDPGALGRRLREKDVVLDVARRVAAALRAKGIQVVMTRDSDVFVKLDDRVHVANRYNPDLFVSVHADASPDRSATGSTVFYPDDQLGGGKADITYRAILHARGSSVDAALVGSPGRLSEPVEAAVFGALLEEYRARSRDAAGLILRATSREAGTRPRGIHEANYRVVRYLRSPTVLVELDFLTNSAAESRFDTPAYRQRLAEGIAEGIESYLRQTPGGTGESAR